MVNVCVLVDGFWKVLGYACVNLARSHGVCVFGKGWVGLYLCKYVGFRQLLVLTILRILFVSIVLMVFIVGCCDALVTDLACVGTGTYVGAEGAQALAQAVENNSTLTTLNLRGTC